MCIKKTFQIYKGVTLPPPYLEIKGDLAESGIDWHSFILIKTLMAVSTRAPTERGPHCRNINFLKIKMRQVLEAILRQSNTIQCWSGNIKINCSKTVPPATWTSFYKTKATIETGTYVWAWQWVHMQRSCIFAFNLHVVLRDLSINEKRSLLWKRQW